MLNLLLRFLGLIDTAQTQNNNEPQKTRYFSDDYYKEKLEIDTNALYGCRYFEPIDRNIFKQNSEFFKNKQCPNCNSLITQDFKKNYKCPSCKQKIHKLNDIISKEEGFYTEEQKELRNTIKKELSKRKKFFNIISDLYKNDNYKLEEPIKTDNYKENLQKLIDIIYIAKPEYYKKSSSYTGYSKLRMCRFYLAEIFELLEQEQQAKEMWCQVLCLDLIDELSLCKQNLSELERAVLERNVISYSYKRIANNMALKEIKPILQASTTILLNDISYKTTLNFDIIWDLVVKYDKILSGLL